MSTPSPAFIVCHGSFNPVHKHHLEMMVQARAHLEAHGYTVVRGVLGITNRQRLTYKGVEAVADNHRLAALHLGCSSVPGPEGWLTPDARGTECSNGSQLIATLRQEFEQECPGAAIFKVVGADTALRYKSELGGPTVVVCRAGDTANLRKVIQSKHQSREDLFVVEELSGEECSSTKVRAALTDGNEALIQQMCPLSVAEYLLENRQSLYNESASRKRGEASENKVDKGWRTGNSSSGSGALNSTQAGSSQKVTLGGSEHMNQVIGVSGASRSGKSTLAQNLLSSFPKKHCCIVGQDNFHLKGRHVAKDSWIEKDGEWVRDWETPNQTNWDAFLKAIRDAKSRFPLVIVEGFSLLHNEEVCALLEGLIWLEVDKETLRRRRTSIPKGWEKNAYFDECIWPAHTRYRKLVFGDASVLGEEGRSSKFGNQVMQVDGIPDLQELCHKTSKEVEGWQPSKFTQSAEALAGAASTTHASDDDPLVTSGCMVSLQEVERLCQVGTAGETVERQHKALAASGSKAVRAQIARETLSILSAGKYTAPGSGETVDLSSDLCKAVVSSRFVAAEKWHKPVPVAGTQRLSCEVRCCTVMAAAQDLARSDECIVAPGVLNFASARNPGGGFTTGAEAQEESLARSSGIYPCLSKHFKTFFEPHRRAASGLYTHGLIHSPQVPVLRDEHGMLLDEPYLLDFVTAAAPNCGVLTGRCSAREAAAQCSAALRERMRRVLHMFASNGCIDIVLGAWGCGVFQNDPATVAYLFNEALQEIPYFRKVIFAVLDPGMAQIFGEVLQTPVHGTENAFVPHGKGKGKGKRQSKDEGKSEPQSGGGEGRKQRRWNKANRTEND